MSAGYIFGYNIEKPNDSKIKEEIKKIFDEGCFGTRNNSPKNRNKIFCDYLSMKPGDNIYFFCHRKLYGIGTLIIDKNRFSKENSFDDCMFWASEDKKNEFISESQKQNNNNTQISKNVADAMVHIKFTFQYDSDFYNSEDKEPVRADMDDVLKYKPSSFRNLRFFSNLSFIKIDDEENQALKEFFYLNREIQKHVAKNIDIQRKIPEEELKPQQNKKQGLLKIIAKDIYTYNNNTTELPQEMILEAHVIEALKKGKNELTTILGEWDYISHQVVASPFKPAEYSEHMDIFCIKYLKSPGMQHVPCGFLILELKKGELSVNRKKKEYPKGGEVEETLNQLMKYVDWVCNEYAHGDYRLIKSAIIANSYRLEKKGKKGEQKENPIFQLEKMVTRHSLTETHPISHESWSDVSLISYSYRSNGKMEYKKEIDFNDLDLKISK